jgi:hypothetical protein
MTSIDKINALVDKYSLSETVKEAIIAISKEAYITGSNDASKALKQHHEGVNRIVKSELEKLINEWLK